MKLNKNGFSLVEGLLIVLILVVVGFAGYYVWSVNSDDDDNTTPVAQNSNSDNTSNTPAETQYSATAFDTTLSFTAPSSWDVSIATDESSAEFYPDASLDEVYVTSPSGLVFHAWPNGGVGGDCEPDSYTYTLVGVINTSQDDLYFTEYTTTSDIDFSIDAEWNDSFDITVGETRTGVCENIYFHGLGYQSYFMDLEDTNGDDVTFAEVNADSDFVKFLNSISVVTSQ